MPIVLATWEADTCKIMVQAQPSKKLVRPPSQSITGHGGSYLSFQQWQKHKIGGSQFKPAWVKSKTLARHGWFMPVILTTQEVEIRGIAVQSQPREIVHKTLPQKNPSQKRAGGGLEFKLCCRRAQTERWGTKVFGKQVH
jgi:hypothetical protein